MTTPSTPVGIDNGHPIAPGRPQSALRHLLGQLGVSVVATLALALLVSGIYPVVVWGISQAVFHDKANGSLVVDQDGKVRGSYLLGQTFSDAKYFHPRPSAAGAGYAADASSGTNLGPTSDKLINGIHGSKKPDGTPDPASDFDGVKDLAGAYRKENGLSADAPVPADAVTRSGSGLDPHVSVANARLQAARVAKARGMAIEEVKRLIDQNTEGRGLGLLGEPGVNVVRLNLALDRKPADSR
jgi:K+-transporting ATPase ATPase C chain